jgi:hypothetical protein
MEPEHAGIAGTAGGRLASNGVEGVFHMLGMKYRLFFPAAFAAVLWTCVLVVQAQEPAGKPETRPAAADVPWSQPVDGLACRLVVAKDALLNEPLIVVFEIKNVSDRKRFVVEPAKAMTADRFLNNDYATLSVTDAGGKAMGPAGWGKFPLALNDFKPIAPGEVLRASINLLTSQSYPNVPRTAGQYRLKLALTSPKPARAPIPGSGIGRWVNGKPVVDYTYADPTKEQVDNAWTSSISAEATVTVRDLPPKLTVHEWGVFSSFADGKYANADRKQEWASMPDEFYRQFPTHKLRGVEVLNPNPPEALTKKPIIYFYSDRLNLHLDVKLTFAQGAPAVWWPCAQSPLDDGSGKPGDIFRTLQWSGKLTANGSEEVGAGFRISDYTVKTGPDSWVNQARIEGPAWFFTDDQPRFVPPPGPPNQVHTARNGIYSFRYQSEKFIYYDGLIPAANYVQCAALAEDSVTVENSAKFDIANLIVIDRRDAKATRWALVEKLAAGGKATAALKTTDDDKTAAAREELGRELKNAGLFENEAKSALAIWDKGLFDRPGITVIYLLPQSEYDRVLPLAVSPQPDKIVRVGIAMQGQIDLTPAVLAARVKALIVKMDDDDYRLRDKAAEGLTAMGPAAFTSIRKAMEGKISPEVKTRLEKIIAQDGEQYLKP